ncbi:MAG: flagellar filament capping protein FliD [Negativicutes bacterium]|nr:flagellar filament capping protein FliD [Negativicutes bacterium]
MAGTYGLSGSGINVDSVVTQLMAAERGTYNKMDQQKQLLAWKKEAYNTVYTAATTYRTSVFNSSLQSTLAAKATAVSNSAVVSATASAGAGNMSHSITVNQLASGINMTSSGAITTGADKNTLADQFGLGSSTFNIKITNNGVAQTITVDPTASINTFVSQLNSAGLNLNANYDTTLDRFFLTTTNTGASASIDFTGSDAAGLNFLQNNLKINTAATTKSSGVPVTTGTAYSAGTYGAGGVALTAQMAGMATDTGFSSGPPPTSLTLQIGDGTNSTSVTFNPASTSMDDMVQQINTAATNNGVKVTAQYNATTDTFSLNAGSGASVDLSGNSGDGQRFLQNDLKLNTTKYAQTGSDAIFSLDGVNNLAEASNSFIISGVSYNVASTGSSTVSVSTDVNSIVSAVQALVTSYNTELAALNTAYNQPVYSDYQPLTNAQESSMSANDITLWNAKAQSGMLNNDSYLGSLINNMRDNMYTPVKGLTTAYNSAAALGITTGDYTQLGQLTLNTDTLKAALAADPNAAYEVFGTTGSSTDSSTQGIAVRLRTTLQTSLTQISQEAGTSPDVQTGDQSFLATEINSFTSQMSNESTRLDTVQSRYYNQFNAMETAIQQLNAQSSWLSSMLGTSSSSG